MRAIYEGIYGREAVGARKKIPYRPWIGDTIQPISTDSDRIINTR
jgi:hypothetical protein